MILVIDGYNLLKQIFPGLKESLEKQRLQFIRQLSYYKSKKTDIKDIVVVFDAGPSNHATREVRSGIVVVYSGQKSDADTWIIDYVERMKNQELLVVSNDNKLIAACIKLGATGLKSNDFYNILQSTLLENIFPETTATELPTTDLEKYTHDDWDDTLSTKQNGAVDPKAIDMLMEQESLFITKDLSSDDAKIQEQRRRSKKYTASKQEKKTYAKLKKL